ncbi:MAG: hypothetical protein JSV60_03085, partial [Desulfobacterales bacterium]
VGDFTRFLLGLDNPDFDRSIELGLFDLADEQSLSQPNWLNKPTCKQLRWLFGLSEHYELRVFAERSRGKNLSWTEPRSEVVWRFNVVLRFLWGDY